MKSQLVLKFRHRPQEDRAYIGALEAALAAMLGDSALVDGHDVRASDINIFLVTSDPLSTFRRAKPVLESMQLLDKVVAAHRFEGGSSFKVIWPLKWDRKFKVE